METLGQTRAQRRGDPESRFSHSGVRGSRSDDCLEKRAVLRMASRFAVVLEPAPQPHPVVD